MWGFILVNKNNYYLAQNVEIWRRIIECGDLISACTFDVTCHALT